ncbi:MAG: OsmC family protein [Acidobacteria bacterium]|nr:OsmC family protein [Acidobacteriota bacterium]
MQQASVRWTEGEQFLVVGPSGHELVVDADRSRNTGPGPMELLLLALGACTGSDVVSILKKKRQQVTGVEIRVEGERAAEPPRVWTELAVRYRIAGKKLDPRAVEHAIELSRTKYCSVAATLGRTATIRWSHTLEEAD